MRARVGRNEFAPVLDSFGNVSEDSMAHEIFVMAFLFASVTNNMYSARSCTLRDLVLSPREVPPALPRSEMIENMFLSKDVKLSELKGGKMKFVWTASKSKGLPLEIPTTVVYTKKGGQRAKFTWKSTIGSGGYGTVETYEYRDPRSGKTESIAVKLGSGMGPSETRVIPDFRTSGLYASNQDLVRAREVESTAFTGEIVAMEMMTKDLLAYIDGGRGPHFFDEYQKGREFAPAFYELTDNGRRIVTCLAVVDDIRRQIETYFLYNQNLVYVDLKAQNILVHDEGKDWEPTSGRPKMTVSLGDIGSMISSGGYRSSTFPCPELSSSGRVRFGGAHDTIRYKRSCLSYQVGLLLADMVNSIFGFREFKPIHTIVTFGTPRYERLEGIRDWMRTEMREKYLVLDGASIVEDTKLDSLLEYKNPRVRGLVVASPPIRAAALDDETNDDIDRPSYASVLQMVEINGKYCPSSVEDPGKAVSSETSSRPEIGGAAEVSSPSDMSLMPDGHEERSHASPHPSSRDGSSSLSRTPREDPKKKSAGGGGLMSQMKRAFRGMAKHFQTTKPRPPRDRHGDKDDVSYQRNPMLEDNRHPLLGEGIATT